MSIKLLEKIELELKIKGTMPINDKHEHLRKNKKIVTRD
jgi:hypothetical protein